MENNILQIDNRKDFREWLALHAGNESECWVELKRGKPVEDDKFYYLDAVEEALCFGWIDSTHKLIAGKRRLWSSDAHHLGDILEAVSDLPVDRFSLGGLFDAVSGK